MGAQIDDRLTALVERMFETSFNASEFHEAVGIAMDAMRIDLLKVSKREWASKKWKGEYGL